MPRTRSSCGRNLFRYSFIRFIIVIAFFWTIFVLWITQWNRKFSNVVDDKLVNVDFQGIIQGRIIDVAGKANLDVDDFEDFDKARVDEYQDYLVDSEPLVEVNGDIKGRDFVDVKPNLIGLHRIPKPTFSPEILDIHRRLNLTNPGHMGQPVKILNNAPSDIIEMLNKSWETYQINELGSKLVPLDRQLPDMRTDYCRNKTYAAQLPMASVIMIFHNEALSMILRTVYSILIHSPMHLLKEIVLVDDCSTHENLHKTLETSIAELPKVKIVRSPLRIGLMRARMLGAVNTPGPALVFMDSHMEVTRGWLEPLLDRLAFNKNITAISSVETLNFQTMEVYYHRDPRAIPVTGFDWNLIFNWKQPPESEHKRRSDPNEPIVSPTMLGAFFVIDKEYFELLGMYDPGFEIWGGENLELAFKVWMCGGRVEVIPCSRVVHLFRKKFPYAFPVGGGEVRRNTDRLAEVWLDEYKRFYYRKVGSQKRDYGDVTEQKRLRDKLGCKSFKWYLENVYTDYKIPPELMDPTTVKVEVNEVIHGDNQQNIQKVQGDIQQKNQDNNQNNQGNNDQKNQDNNQNNQGNNDQKNQDNNKNDQGNNDQKNQDNNKNNQGNNDQKNQDNNQNNQGNNDQKNQDNNKNDQGNNDQKNQDNNQNNQGNNDQKNQDNNKNDQGNNDQKNQGNN